MTRRALCIAILASIMLSPTVSFAQGAQLLTVEGRTRCQEACMVQYCQRARRFHKNCDPYQPNDICQKKCICFGADCRRR